MEGLADLRDIVDRQYETSVQAAEALFYLDPPYHRSEGDYGRELFGRDHFAMKAERLGRLNGGFILSINGVPEIRETFGCFDVKAVDLLYTLSGGKGGPARELIVKSRERSSSEN